MDHIACNTAIAATESSLISGSECVNENIDIFGGKQDEGCNSSLKINGDTCMGMERPSNNYNKPENSDTLVSTNENSVFNKKCVTASHQCISGITNTPVTSPMEHFANGLSPDNCDVTILTIFPNSNNYQGKSRENVSSHVLTREESSVSQLRNPTCESDENFTCSFAEQLNPLIEQIQYDVCHQCQNSVTKVEDSLTWGSMTFCNGTCLGYFQKLIGAFCAKCNAMVETKCLGKYSVHFVFGIKQFCSKVCLEVYKKCLRKCSYCQQDVSDKQSILVPDDEHVRVFCSMKCINKWESQINCKQCAVCNKNELVHFEVLHNYAEYKLCSDHCFAAFKFVNNIDAVECRFCKKYFDKSSIDTFTIFGNKQNFCSKGCKKLYLAKLKEIVSCDYCKVKKYKYDMLKSMTKNNTILTVCSLNCLTCFRASFVSDQLKCFTCNGFIESHSSIQSENREEIFCSHECLNDFKNKILKKKQIIGENNCSPPSEAVKSNKAENEKIDCVNFGEQGRENVSVQVFPVVCSKEISVFPEVNSVGTQTELT